MPLKQYDQIKLRDDYQGTLGDQQAIETDRNRTPGKDEVARYIIDRVIAKDKWPMNATDIADEVEYSRQHVSNVLADYFEAVDATTNGQADAQSTTTTQDSKPFSAAPSDSTSSANTESSERPETVWVLKDGSHKKIDITVPNDVETRSSYIRGFLDGLKGI